MYCIFQLVCTYIHLLRVIDDVTKLYPWQMYDDFKMVSVVLIIEIQQVMYIFFWLRTSEGALRVRKH
jgi:hypothetical protein